MDSDGEQSDFKTTTLRFTNNNFIEERQRRDRDNSQGGGGGREGPSSTSLLNTLSSHQNQVSQLAQLNQKRNQKQFGTSDNFKSGAAGIDHRTDSFHRLQNNKSPQAYNQISTQHGFVRSDAGADDPEEEELIEEDICDNGESPLITAQTKQNNG